MWGDAATPLLLAVTDWAFQLDLMGPLSEVNILDLDYGDADNGTDPLISEEEKEDDMFVTPARAAKPMAPTAVLDEEGRSTPASSLSGVDMLEVCKGSAGLLP